MRVNGTRAREAAGPSLVAVQSLPLSELALPDLRGYRRRLADEEEKVSYWRRVVHARIDVLEAESRTERPLRLDELVRVLGDTGSGRSRSSLGSVEAADPLPELPVLADIWTEVDLDDSEQVASAVATLRSAEQQLTEYRRALHGRLDEATGELIRRYRADPRSALVAFDTPHRRASAPGR